MAVLLLASGCETRPQRDSSELKRPYKVTTTVGMVTDVIRQVAGDMAVVEGIIGEGVDPHLFRATRSDIARLLTADAVFYSGLMLEGKLAGTLATVRKRGRPIYAVTERLDSSYLLHPDGLEGHPDPHVWMDVRAWMKAVEVAADALAEVDPPHAECYADNARRYSGELAELDTYVRGVIDSIPQEKRVLITAHDAFNYFGRAYGLKVIGIQGLSTESEASIQGLNRLVDFIVANRIGAVFVESSVADKQVQALIAGARARGRDVVNGGQLFSDAMGAPGTYEGTYIGMIDHNATTIARALGGRAPARGMHGRLGAAAR